MKNSKSHKLVEGTFNPSDSINILFALFNSKINFHQLESFRIHENSSNINISDQHNQRALELKETYLFLKNIVNKASDENMDLEIFGSIEVKPIKRKLTK